MGSPESCNRTTGSYGEHEQWVYEYDVYLYFENGILTAVQHQLEKRIQEERDKYALFDTAKDGEG